MHYLAPLRSSPPSPPPSSIIVDNHTANCARGVNDEDSTKGSSEHVVLLVGDEDTVVVGDGLAGVGEERNVEGSNSTVFTRSARPGEVSVVTVSRNSSHSYTHISELARRIREGTNLSRAHERVVKGVEEEDEPLSSGGVVGEGYLSELVVKDSCSREIRSLGTRKGDGLEIGGDERLQSEKK